MAEWRSNYREIRMWSLYARIPRQTILRAHLQREWSEGDGNRAWTRCGRLIHNGGAEWPRYVTMHVSLARAIGAEDCKRCLR